ncbi:4-aminobutyrate--2-oxoglutarate transaminase [Caenispirillum bisanense]|uniref:4-aminobutyrate aminotransferase / (S)-3-amino-2-methylpropionate transaminase n=1 Tax=Caenispirillum bisanense TaxID=414052 RepID=A0A286GWR8_9PROT|nr:4-aminobutyrate--2-oxoglutarate transaminase [Caenispirillum bisanense]SOD99985.1 4-aminobutyrate aminotransferase / (S)-3-amino-2-methylpropionate transaminase [Caenispirillum bisanense]
MTANTELAARRESAIPRGVATMLPVFTERAENAEIWDVEGKRYIDFAGGIAVLNTGHMHPKVKAAVAGQLDKFSHTCFQVTPYESYVVLAEKLNALVPGNSPKKTLFLTTGAEAVENAVKIARAYTKRSAVVAFSGAFHGRTMMGMALTGKVMPYKAGFGPMPAEVFHAPFPNAYHGVSVEDSLKYLDTLFKSDVDPARVAAMILEPVQGEGGFNVAPAEWLQALRKICDEHGILLIVDEIQTGFARTGKMFAIEHSGVEPDMMTMAKSLAGGFPLSAVTGKAEIMDGANPGGLGGTYAGSPLACAAGLAVLDVIEEEGLVARANEIGTLMTDRLKAMAQKNSLSCIGDIRGLGAMVAMELVTDRDTRAPAADLTKALVQAVAKKGLILLACGTRANVIRFLVPLTASDALVKEGMDIIESTLEELAAAA